MSAPATALCRATPVRPRVGACGKGWGARSRSGDRALSMSAPAASRVHRSAAGVCLLKLQRSPAVGGVWARSTRRLSRDGAPGAVGQGGGVGMGPRDRAGRRGWAAKPSDVRCAMCLCNVRCAMCGGAAPSGGTSSPGTSSPVPDVPPSPFVGRSGVSSPEERSGLTSPAPAESAL